MSRRCENCGGALSDTSNFCLHCGTPVAITAVAKNTKHMQQSAQNVGPLRFVAQRVRLSFANLKTTLKTPSKLVPTLLLAVVWLVLSLLPFFGIDASPVRVLSFLTFARGGMFGGLFGAAGGILGKAMIAYFLNGVLLPIFKGAHPFKNGGLKTALSGMAGAGASAVSSFLGGAGSALVLYNFMNANAGLENAMVGVIALFTALQAVGKRSGFLFGLFFSFAGKLSKGRTPSYETVNKAIGGAVIGFALAVALTAVPFRWTCGVAGLLLLLLALFSRGGKRKAVAQ